MSDDFCWINSGQVDEWGGNAVTNLTTRCQSLAVVAELAVNRAGPTLVPRGWI